jgi:hypothetical protein
MSPFGPGVGPNRCIGIGVFLNLREIVAAQQLSQILGPNAPICLRNPG